MKNLKDFEAPVAQIEKLSELIFFLHFACFICRV